MLAIDFSTGLYAFQAVAAALYKKATKGRGAYIETSLLECAIASISMRWGMPVAPRLIDIIPRIGLHDRVRRRLIVTRALRTEAGALQISRPTASGRSTSLRSTTRA